MNIYDQTHELARSLRECDEYQELLRLKEQAYSDDTNRALLDEYKRLQYQIQYTAAQGKQIDEDSAQRIQAIAGLLQFNQDASTYLLAEFRFQKTLADIYKILAEAIGINLDMLTGQ